VEVLAFPIREVQASRHPVPSPPLLAAVVETSRLALVTIDANDIFKATFRPLLLITNSLQHPTESNQEQPTRPQDEDFE
jgi:hypothetical protein